jgi:cyclic pyranopterin phosphate synthase
VIRLFERLGEKIGRGLSELTLTTNGSQLARFAAPLYAAGVRRVNVSLDTRDSDKFRAITRLGDLKKVLAGIDAAQAAGLSVKINMVALKGVNEDEIEDMLLWAHGRGMDLTLIETMPLGDVDAERAEQYLPLSLARSRLITPLTHNFCESCNRVRVTCTGTLYMCLGQNDSADLRTPLRASRDDALLDNAIEEAITRKPKGHDFIIDRRSKTPAVGRTMSLTGG